MQKCFNNPLFDKSAEIHLPKNPDNLFIEASPAHKNKIEGNFQGLENVSEIQNEFDTQQANLMLTNQNNQFDPSSQSQYSTSSRPQLQKMPFNNPEFQPNYAYKQPQNYGYMKYQKQNESQQSNDLFGQRNTIDLISSNLAILDRMDNDQFVDLLSDDDDSFSMSLVQSMVDHRLQTLDLQNQQKEKYLLNANQANNGNDFQQTSQVPSKQNSFYQQGNLNDSRGQQQSFQQSSYQPFNNPCFDQQYQPDSIEQIQLESQQNFGVKQAPGFEFRNDQYSQNQIQGNYQSQDFGLYDDKQREQKAKEIASSVLQNKPLDDKERLKNHIFLIMKISSFVSSDFADIVELLQPTYEDCLKYWSDKERIKSNYQMIQHIYSDFTSVPDNEIDSKLDLLIAKTNRIVFELQK